MNCCTIALSLIDRSELNRFTPLAARLPGYTHPRKSSVLAVSPNQIARML
jgi:hypothetical protein